MKQILLVSLILLGCLTAQCPAETAVPRIRVFGESEIITPPDRAVIRIRVETRGRSGRVAGEQHRNALENIFQVLGKQGIAPGDIRKSKPGPGPENAVVSRLSVTSQDLGNLPGLIRALAARAGIVVETVVYGHSRESALIEEARTAALVDAGATARSMAAVLGACLGDVLLIRESDSSVSRIGADLGIPDIRIQMKLEVVFRLECQNPVPMHDPEQGS